MNFLHCGILRCGLVLGTLLVSGGLELLIQGAEPVDVYRQHARKSLGDRERGKALFDAATTQCALCHTVDGKRTKAGPDLRVVGDKHSRTDLIDAILNPSAAIMMGYSTTVVETKEGDSFEGVLETVDDETLSLAGEGGVGHEVHCKQIESRTTSQVSLMPEGLHAALSKEEFTDLVAYLESLKETDSLAANRRGTPGTIARIEHPVLLRPFVGKPLDFVKPIWFGEHPLLDDHYLIAEQTRAKISLLRRNGAGFVPSTFVDVSGEVFVTDTEGLLGVAFHPEFERNRKYYLMHEFMEGTQRAMIIAERLAHADYTRDSGRRSRQVLRIDVGTEVHHGGGIEFGPDGYLYIGMGDAGPQEDPQGHGQDLFSLAGKLLRIDVDGRDPGLGYRIPPENPFADFRQKARPEVFAWGLRQPWRFSFDSKTDELWVGDVGQNRFEEICLVRSGENHGWNVYEGFELFSTVYRRDEVRYVQPLVSFSRRHGASVTAGYVYREKENPSFDGVYICGDYESRRLWGLRQRDGTLETIREIGESPAKIVAFGRDRRGGIYVIGYDLGEIYRIDFSSSVFQ